jgi:hypothetical protein
MTMYLGDETSIGRRWLTTPEPKLNSRASGASPQAGDEETVRPALGFLQRRRQA